MTRPCADVEDGGDPEVAAASSHDLQAGGIAARAEQCAIPASGLAMATPWDGKLLLCRRLTLQLQAVA